MDCKNTEKYTLDFIEGSLPQEEEKGFKKHITNCKNCKKNLDDTIILLKSFNNIPTQKPSPKVSANFYKMLAEEKQLQTKVIPISKNKSINYKTAFQIAASFLLLFSGYFFGTYKMQNTNKEIATLINETKQLKQNMMLAMIDNRSPSKRIKAVNFTEEIEKPDTKVLNALIDRLKFDSNINVRLAAVEALSKFTKIELVKTTLINTLTTEKNPSIQIEIIQILVKIQEKRALVPMQNLLDKPETPDFVKDQITSGISNLI